MSLTPVKSSPPNVNTVLQSNAGDRVSSSKSEIAPVVAILTRQLPLPQAQQLAGQTALVKVVKGGPGNDAELEFAGQNIQVKLPPGRSLTAGEMVTVSFALSDKADDLSAGGASGKPKVGETRNLLTTLPSLDSEGETQESPSFVDRLSGSARLIGFLEKIGQRTGTQVSTSVMSSLKQLDTDITESLRTLNAPQTAPATQGKPDTRPTSPQNGARQTSQASTVANLSNSLAGALAKQVSAAIENSGLFYESHLQQWANGQRSTDQINQEPQARFGPEQVITEKGMSQAAVDQSAKLVTAQLATLDNNRISLALTGLLGQPVSIEIEPDPDDDEHAQQAASEEGSRPWVARLKLDMAHLGELHVRVRMVGSQCDVQISGAAHSKQAIDPHWQTFQRAMSDQGLKLVHGQFLVSSGHTIDQ